MKHTTALLQAILGCFVLVPPFAHAQTCEWGTPPAPSAGTEVIEVIKRGGYGPFAGRTVVSMDAAGRITLLGRGQCPDRTLVGQLGTPSFEDVANELRDAVESVRNHPARPSCPSLDDSVDVDVTVYRDGERERYTCVTGALLQFGESLLEHISAAICANRATRVCIGRMVEHR